MSLLSSTRRILKSKTHSARKVIILTIIYFHLIILPLPKVSFLILVTKFTGMITNLNPNKCLTLKGQAHHMSIPLACWPVVSRVLQSLIFFLFVLLSSLIFVNLKFFYQRIINYSVPISFCFILLNRKTIVMCLYFSVF
jgi:hypothetical protein